MDFTHVKAGDSITYIGNNPIAYCGDYLVVTAESTYNNPNDCPEYEKGLLMIIEFMNNDTPMFFSLTSLDPNEWKLKIS